MDSNQTAQVTHLTTATLLLVDDEQNILSSLQRVFRSEGYRILTAESGVQGLELLASETVDLVISDLRMPKMDGAQFLTEVAEQYPATVRILLTGFADLDSTVEAINNGQIYAYVAKPWDDTDLRLKVHNALEKKYLTTERERLLDLTRQQNDQLSQLNETLEQRVKDRTKMLKKLLDKLHQSYFSAVPIFAHLIQLREHRNKGHGKRVADLAKETAMFFGLDDEECRDIFFAGLLHDVGKIGLPDEVLDTPYLKQTPEQHALNRMHPQKGQAILMGLEPLERTANIIRNHHEAYGGGGYPDSLSGEGIPLGSRILMACNEYDCLLHGTLLGEKYSEQEALAYLQEHANKRYDPTVVEALVAVLKRRKRILDEGEANDLVLSPGELQSGMRLSRDLFGVHDVMLLNSGVVLDEELVEKIRKYEEDVSAPIQVYVYAESVGIKQGTP